MKGSRQRSLRKRGVLLVVAACVVVVGGALGIYFGLFFGGGTVTAIMPFLAGLEWSGFYAAQNPNEAYYSSSGFYAQEGLDVELTYTTQGGYGAVQQVAAGQADFGYAAADSVILGRSRGLPVVAVYHPERANLFSVIVREDSGIRQPEDLAGKTIAIPGPGSPSDIAARAMLSAEGVDLDSIEFVPVGGGLVSSLSERTADAAAGYIITEIVLEGMGVPIRVFYARDYVGEYGGTALITTEDMIEKRPELVREFVSATDKGFEFAIGHPEVVVDAFIASNPDAEEYREVEERFWGRLVNEVYKGYDSAFGALDMDRWQQTMETLLELGVIDQPVEVEDAFTTEFLP